MNDEHTQSVMVALRPITTAWSKIALPHLTLVYAGEKQDLKPTDFNELAKVVASIAMEFHTITLYSTGLGMFGTDPDWVEVVKLQPTPALMMMHRRVSGWDKSTFPFSPHCTIGPEGSSQGDIPQALAFDRIMLSWGEEELNFWLRP